MLSIKPELQKLNPLPMFRKDPRHMESGGVVGFSGSYDHGGMLSDLTPKNQGKAITELGTKLGAEAVLRSGSVGAEGINRYDNASFANVMLSAIDKVSDLNNRASELAEMAMIDPSMENVHDLTIAQSEATMSLNIARTLLNRLTQAWKDLINTR